MYTEMKKVIKFLLLLVVVAAVMIQAVALIKCEILTKKHYSEFEFAYKSNTMLGDMEYFKVLSCDETTARVYYVEEGNTVASVLTFEKENDAWVETRWDTIWSTRGSASDVIWPYWWHFIYGGF